MHLTFSSYSDASNSPGLLMVIQKEAVAKQSECSSATYSNGHK